MLVAGATGKVGRELVRAILAAEELELVGGVARRSAGQDLGLACGLQPLGIPVGSSVPAELERARPEVLVDFTSPDAVWDHATSAVEAGVHLVIGTTGLDRGRLERLDRMCRDRGVGGVFAPNFAVGAVLMIRFAREAAALFDSCAIIELHHATKKDAPSGTARYTAEEIEKGRRLAAAAGSEQSAALGLRLGPEAAEEAAGGTAATASAERGRPSGPLPGAAGGAVPVYSVRLPGLVAHQEVIFGLPGQTLTIRHDSTSRESFVPGVLLAIRRVPHLTGLVVGLEGLLPGIGE